MTIKQDREKTVVTTTRVTVRPESRKEFFQSISPLTQRIRGEKGCVNYALYEEMGDENSLILIEEWAAEARWNEHRLGENFSILLGLITILAVPAKLDFKLLAQVGGNEMLDRQ